MAIHTDDLEIAAIHLAAVLSRLLDGPEEVFSHLTLLESMAIADVLIAIDEPRLAADLIIRTVLDDEDVDYVIALEWAEIAQYVELGNAAGAGRFDNEWREFLEELNERKALP